jgi:uncharacterized repeat protein (TIGR03803 family)
VKVVSFLNRPSLPLSPSKPGVFLRAALLACAALVCSSAATAQTAGNITQLIAFPCSQSGTCAGGANPSSLIQASDGNFYGTTQTSEFERFQGGTIFKLTPTGKATLLFTFTANSQGNFLNGNSPTGGLVEGADGFLFGTAALGGANNQGVVFRISKSGKGFQVLHSFCAQVNCADGAVPVGGLTLGNDGSLFGTTNAGGIESPFCLSGGGCGTIFHITETGSFKVLHALNFSTDGGTPLFGLLKGSDGNFYGLDQGNNANGNIFRITPGGQFSIVFNLPDTDDPVTGLVQASNGNLFGATINGEGGTEIQLFTITIDGTGFQSLPPAFNATIQLETFPTLIQASDGNLWGVFSTNGNSGNGTVFSLGLDGTLLQSISFDGADGAQPNSQLVQKTDGTLVGTTSSGGVVPQGDNSGGTVFTLNVGLPAPTPVIAAFTPSSGAVGTKVTIRGSNFVGTTAVAFNGVSASFQVLNSQFLSATVPTGATSGPIKVTNQGGTATGTQTFTVN